MRTITVLISVCTLLFCSTGFSKENYTGVQKKSETLNEYCKIPFGLMHKLILVQAKVNGIEGYLCLDTGIKELLLNDQIFAGGKKEAAFVNSNGEKVNVTKTFGSVELGCLTKEFKGVGITNLDHIFGQQSESVLGMVGWDIFSKNELLIDYLNHEIVVFILDVKGERKDSTRQSNSAIETTKLRFTGELPFIEGEVNNIKLVLILDTGASANVMNSSLLRRLDSQSIFVKNVATRQWGNVTKEFPLTNLHGLKFGTIELYDLKTLWYNLRALNNHNGDIPMDGIVGLEIFKQYIISINFKTNVVSFFDYTKENYITTISDY